MSQANIERYRRSVDAWNRGVCDEWLDCCVTPGWELVTGLAFPGLKAVYRGREGAREMWSALRGPWDERGLHLDIERIEDLGDRLLALVTMRGTGSKSGVDVAIRWAHVVSYEGRDERLHSYASWQDGLRAVGLPDQA